MSEKQAKRTGKKDWATVVQRLATTTAPVQVASGSGKWRSAKPLDAIRDVLSGKVARVRVESRKQSAWTLEQFCRLNVEAKGELLLRGFEKRVAIVTGTNGTEVFYREKAKPNGPTLTKSFGFLAADELYGKPIDYSVDGGTTWLPCHWEKAEWEELKPR